MQASMELRRDSHAAPSALRQDPLTMKWNRFNATSFAKSAFAPSFDPSFCCNSPAGVHMAALGETFNLHSTSTVDRAQIRKGCNASGKHHSHGAWPGAGVSECFHRLTQGLKGDSQLHGARSRDGGRGARLRDWPLQREHVRGMVCGHVAPASIAGTSQHTKTDRWLD